MRSNLYWLDHDHSEDSGDNAARVKPYSNLWKVDMETALVNTQHQPTKKLHDAIVARRRVDDKHRSSEGEMQGPNINPSASQLEFFSLLDKQVTLKARLLQIKVDDAIIRDRFDLFGKGQDMPQHGRMSTKRFLQNA